eukprot:GGOE01008826.1.p3 GENE.GGOE01008826.1~~GGOE01008826.1.p3  ORF type:complete len:148 (-),score=7.11 GGOE01008826.1:275-718(-)
MCVRCPTVRWVRTAGTLQTSEVPCAHPFLPCHFLPAHKFRRFPSCNCRLSRCHPAAADSDAHFLPSSTQLPPNHFAILPFALCLLHPPPNARSTTSPAPQHGGSPHVWPAPRFLLNGTAHKKDGAILLLQSFKICVAGANVRLVLLR